MEIDWRIYTIIYETLAIIVLLIVFILTKRQAMNRIKLLFLKKKGYGIVYEIRSTKQTNEVVAELKGDSIKINNRTYGVDHNDYFISSYYGCPAIYVSENLRNSINPNNASVVLPTTTTIGALIKQAFVEGNPEIVKWLKIGAFALGLVFIALIFLGFVEVKIMGVVNTLANVPARI